MANIREQFPEFFQDTIEMSDLESDSDNLIVFDTNFLLDIIQNPTDIGEKYIESLVKVQNNIYIPYLVALEFNFRKSGIKKEKHKNIQEYINNIKGDLKNLEKSISDHELINIKQNKEEFSCDLLTEVKKFEEKILPMVDSKIFNTITKGQDTIYNELISIIENKIGEKYTQDWIDEVQVEGEKRYKNGIPPGFDDGKKEDEEEPSRRYGDICYKRKFGDLIIWKDIINYSEKNSKKGSKVIYVTNDGQSDKKNDLLYKVKNLIVGPHISLMNELQTQTQKELYILANVRFIKLVTELTDVQVKEIESLSKTSESWDKKDINISKLSEDHFEQNEERKLNIELLKEMKKIDRNIEEIENMEEELKELEESYFKNKNHYNDKELFNKEIEIDRLMNKLRKLKMRYSKDKEKLNMKIEYY